MELRVILPQSTDDFRSDPKKLKALLTKAVQKTITELYGKEPCIGFSVPLSDQYGYSHGQITVHP